MNLRLPPPPAVSERHVQAIWYDASLRPAPLATAGGEAVRVLSPGEWNLGPGPDFLGAVLELGARGRIVSGDVEIHLGPSDWTAHGHGKDPAYAHVVAHVTWRGGVPPPTLPPGCVSICIGELLRCRPEFSPLEIDVTAYPHAHLPSKPRPCERYFGGNPDFGLEVLREAGRRRMLAKAGRFRALFLRRGDVDQVLYEEVLAAFGYAGSSEAFRRLGRSVPFAALPRDGASAFEALSAALALAEPPPSRRFPVRPANRPERRLTDAAALFTGGKPVRLGAGRAAAVIANVLIPFALARGAVKAPPEWLPPEDVSAPMRLAANRLFGRDHNPALYAGNGVMLQGLMQIHREHCLAARPDCSACALAAWCENALAGGKER